MPNGITKETFIDMTNASKLNVLFDIAKVLDKGGQLFITELCSHDQSWVKASCGDLWLGFDTEDLGDWALSAGFMEGEHDGEYYYNSCRFPLRIACYISQYYQPYYNGKTYYSSSYQPPLLKLVDWAINKCGLWPAYFWPGYHLNGSPITDDGFYDSLAFIGPITAGAIVGNTSKHRHWLRSGFMYLSANFAPYNSDPMKNGYYESTIGLLSMFVINGNWWKP